jgi:uncharacterized membrane protein (DUF485 family)
MTFKDILPFEDYTIKSKLSVEQVELKLKENIEPTNDSIFSTFFRNTTKPYEGYLYKNRFKIKRIIHYSNSFRPTIRGEMYAAKGFTNIRVKMEVNIILLTIWYLLVVIIGVAIPAFNNIFVGLSNKNSVPLGGNGIYILLALFVLTPVVTFKIESRKSKKFLAKLLEEFN